jgi:hypothetical protein
MSKRSLALTSALTVGATAALAVGTASPALAQADPVQGHGNHYFFAGAGNETGQATRDFRYGNRDDVVLVGDWDGDGTDGLIVRRGNRFLVRNDLSNGVAEHEFTYGDPGDTVLVGDWNGDHTDTLAVRRGNRYFIKNDLETGVASTVATFGEPTDQVLVGNWDLNTRHDSVDADLSDISDTLMVRRGNHFFARDSMTSGPADHDFYFGDPGDTVLVGSFAHAAYTYLDGPEPRKEFLYPGYSADGADQLVVRRGNRYYQSEAVWWMFDRPGGSLITASDFSYGNPDDTAFIAKVPYTQPPMEGVTPVLHGDGLAVRRND